jgi:type III pantothenate kinase
LILTINIGNGNLITGVYNSENDKVISTVSITKSMTSDDFAILIKNISELYKISQKPEGVIISSVVPSLTTFLSIAIRKFYNCEPMIVGPGLKTGLNIKINDPSQLGSDLVCMAAAVIDKYPLPVVIIHIGDTTTLSYVDDKAFYCGTVITTGVNLLLNSLVENSDLLTSVPLAAPEKVIGTDTSKSIRSGLIFGTASFIDGMIDRIYEEKGEIASVIATGCYSENIIPYCKKKITISDTLLTDGLYKLYKKNFNSKNFNA